MRATDKIDCEFCGERICEVFRNVDTSQLVRDAVVSHLAHCRKRPAHFASDVLLAYADDLIEARRRRREIQRQLANQRR